MKQFFEAGIFIMVTLVLASCSNQVQTRTDVPSSSIQSEQVLDAVLTDIEGNVTLNGQRALDNTHLHVGDTIRTSSDSEATIVFFDSSRTHLWDNTTLVVQKLGEGKIRAVRLKHTSGELWTRLLRLSGISQFEVNTPNTVAVVRGTGFWISVLNGTTAVGVTEGKVALQHLEGTLVTTERILEKEQQVVVDRQMAVTPLVHDKFINENLEKDEAFITALRQRIGNETFERLMQG